MQEQKNSWTHDSFSSCARIGSQNEFLISREIQAPCVRTIDDCWTHSLTFIANPSRSDIESKSDEHRMIKEISKKSSDVCIIELHLNIEIYEFKTFNETIFKR